MRRIKFLSLVSLFFVLLFVSAAQVSVSEEKKAEVSKALNDLSVPFVENRGQYDEKVSYVAKIFGGMLFVTKTGELIYDLPKVEKQEKDVEAARGKERASKVVGGVVIKERLAGAEVKGVKGIDKAEAKVSYFKGNDPKKWQGGLKTYGRVSLGEVYEGIRLELKARGSNVEKLFYVSAGGDPSQIKVEVEGAKAIKVDDGGACA